MRRLLIAFSAVALIAVACGTDAEGPGGNQGTLAGAARTPAALGAGGVAACADVTRISAPEAAYRDTPVYAANEMPVEEVRDWAATQPGFEDIWVDREHRGWITVAFSEGAEERQRELEDAFPGVGVVAVAVDWTAAELQELQHRVVTELPDMELAVGISPIHGVVTIDVGVLTPDRVAAIEEKFLGTRVCLSGMDPADAPVPGDQPQEGDGWRLLSSRPGAGDAYRTGIAADPASYGELWARLGLDGTPPTVDFEAEVVVWFGAVFGSSCPDIRLDDVIVDHERALVYAEIVLVDPPPACTADANPHAYLVALRRNHLPAGPFAIQLDADDPPAGQPEERTTVAADLTVPGSVPPPGAVAGDPGLAPPHYVVSGDVIEPGIAYPYLLFVHCGVEWLGEFNDLLWRAAEAEGIFDYIPPEWRDLVDDGQNVEVTLELTVDPGAVESGEDPGPAIIATANGISVVYTPATTNPPGCD